VVERAPLKRCWNYAGERDVRPYPVMEFILRNPVAERELLIRARVDTGFSGELILTHDQWEKLRLETAVLPERGVLWTITSPLFTERVNVLLTIPELELELQVVAERLLRFIEERALVGRGVLNKLFLELRGPEKRCCVFRGGSTE